MELIHGCRERKREVGDEECGVHPWSVGEMYAGGHQRLGVAGIQRARVLRL